MANDPKVRRGRRLRRRARLVWLAASGADVALDLAAVAASLAVVGAMSGALAIGQRAATFSPALWAGETP